MFYSIIILGYWIQAGRCSMEISEINVEYDFTSDTPNFWNNYWKNDDVLGHAGGDPDVLSKTLQEYHRLLYSRKLPNGQVMRLIAGNSYNYLTWNNLRFGSDSIIVSFRYKKYRTMIEEVKRHIPDYRGFMEKYTHKAYTIGGEIIFPKRKGGINQSRGCNPYICDRWDLTLECIRKYYNNEENPLYGVLLAEREFFDLFVDFKGYVDFFFLQDCVSKDYQSVVRWSKIDETEKYPFPKTVEGYLLWIENQLQFVKKRNERIKEFIKQL